MMAPVVYTGELLRTPSPDGWWSAGSSFMFVREWVAYSWSDEVGEVIAPGGQRLRVVCCHSHTSAIGPAQEGSALR